jgi:hypothetical protein
MLRRRELVAVVDAPSPTRVDREKPIALYDMDGTLAGYDERMREALKAM